MKKAGFAAFIVLLALLAGLLYGCVRPDDGGGPKDEPVPQEEQIQSKVRIAGIPVGVATYEDIDVFLEEERLPLYSVKTNTAQVWRGDTDTRVDTPVGYFELEGKVNVKVKVPYEINFASQLRPLSAGIVPVANIEDRSVAFTLSNPGSYVLELNGDREKAVHLFVSPFFDFDPSVYGNLIYFGPGLHTKENNNYINDNNIVEVPSDTVVYIDKGAVVRARFEAYNRKNITLEGGGVIDGSVFERNAYTGKATVPLDFGFCENATVKDVSFLDPAGWCINFYFNRNSTVDNIKIITSRSNGDGISLQSCRDIVVRNAFVRSWDDSLVVKNYPLWSDRSTQGETRNILFEDCTLWTDLAQSMEIGYETVGETLTGVTFRNITVLHALHKPVISIHNGNNANITGIRYENITVEDASMGGGDAGANRQLIEISVAYSATWSSQHAVTPLGSVDGVVIDNVLVLRGANDIRVAFTGSVDTREGYGTTHYVKNVSVHNLTIKNMHVTGGYPYLTANQYTEGISVTHGGVKPAGAPFKALLSREQLKKYTDRAQVVLL